MASKKEIDVLFVDKASGAQIGLINFDPSGMLIYRKIKKELHLYALKGINQLLESQWETQPLYVKHAKSLDKKKNLPEEILVSEAHSCADFLNSMENPPTIGSYEVKAQVVVREI